MKKLLKLLVFALFFVAIVFAVAGVAVRTIDANKYRPQLSEILSKKIGRAVRFDGPIAFSLGLNGIRISIEDASLANPQGASRSLMADFGKIELGIDALPLLRKYILVNELLVENTDILFEPDNAGQGNWKFGNKEEQETKREGASTPYSRPFPLRGVFIRGDDIKIVNSRIGYRTAGGQTRNVTLSSLAMKMQNAGAEITIKGDISGVPIMADIKTSLVDLLSRKPFLIKGGAAYDIVHLTFLGKIDFANSKADISAFLISARETKVAGDFEATWSAARPLLKGSLRSKHLNLADFKSSLLTADDGRGQPAVSEQDPQAFNRFFSDALLPFDALRSVDADMFATVGEFPVNKGILRKIKAKVKLADGVLVLDPVKAHIGATPVDVRLSLNAAKAPAHLEMGMVAKDVDLGELQKIADMSPFMRGKAGASVHLAGDGNTPHDIAASFNGIIEVSADKGEIFSGMAADVSSLLGSIFGVSGNDSTLNCLATRFIAKGGILVSNGILIDSATSTVMGIGNVDLGNEVVNVHLQARPKILDVGGLIPRLKIGGSLKKPTYSVNATDIVKNIVGSVVEGDVDVIGSDVPEIQRPPEGQNACIFTLEHPKKKITTDVLPANIIDRAAQGIGKIENLGGSLLKGLLGQ